MDESKCGGRTVFLLPFSRSLTHQVRRSISRLQIVQSLTSRILIQPLLQTSTRVLSRPVFQSKLASRRCSHTRHSTFGPTLCVRLSGQPLRDLV